MGRATNSPRTGGFEMKPALTQSRGLFGPGLTTILSQWRVASVLMMMLWSGSVFGQETRTLLLPPLVSGVDSETARLVEESLGNVLTQQGDRVVRLSDLDSDESARVVSGECQGACLSRLLERSGADQLIQPRISRSGQGYIVQMQFLTSTDGENLEAVNGQEPVVVWLPNEGPGTVHGRLARALSTTQPRTESEFEPDPTPVPIEGGFMVAVQGSAATLRIVPAPPDSEVVVRQENIEDGSTRVRITVRKPGFESAQLVLYPGGSGQQTIQVTLNELPNAESPDALATCTPAGALWRSAILPGWGQYCKGQTLRAGLFFGGFVLTTYNYLSTVQQYRAALSDLRNESRSNALVLALAAYSSTFSFNDAYRYFNNDYLLVQFSDEYVEGKLDRFDCYASSCGSARRLRDERDQAPYLIGIVYIWNLLDAYFAAGAMPESGDETVQADTAGYDFSLAPEPEGGQRAGFSVHWRF